MSLFQQKMMDYFRVEFWCSAPNFPSVVHVVANDSDEAAIIAKAKRIEGGLKGRDAGIEHVWQVHDQSKLKAVEKYRKELAPRILKDTEILVSVVENSRDLVAEREAIIEKMASGLQLDKEFRDMINRVIYIDDAIGVDKIITIAVTKQVALESEDE